MTATNKYRADMYKLRVQLWRMYRIRMKRVRVFDKKGGGK